MDSEDPFQILNISRTSNIEEVKKAFRELIHEHHPDHSPRSDSTFLSQKIIDAYHRIIQSLEPNGKDSAKSTESSQKAPSLFQTQFEVFFQAKFLSPCKKKDFFLQLILISNHFRSFFYSDKDFSFLKEYLGRLTLALTAFQPERWSGYIQAILDCLKHLLQFRKNALAKELGPDEYKLEKLRLEVIRYFKNIATHANNYMELRQSIFLSKNHLITSCIFALNAASEDNSRQELFTIMSIITLFSEEELIDEWEIE